MWTVESYYAPDGRQWFVVFTAETQAEADVEFDRLVAASPEKAFRLVTVVRDSRTPSVAP